MSPVTRTLACLLAGWLLLTSAGCATLNLTHIDLRSRKASVRNPVIRVVCLWEPAEGRDPQGNPCHGFAGQILFLNRTSLPVSSDGDVRIYLFDDQGTTEDQAKPIHQFDFDTGSWAQHYSYGTLGPAYNVFIPYTRKGVYESTCALRLRLSPEKGAPVYSDMTSIELMSFRGGKSAPKVPNVDSRVEETTPEDLLSVNNRRRTTTISLNSENSVTHETPASTGNPTGNQVQQAGYEAEPRPLTNADAKIAQLEQMVKELRELQRERGTPTREAPTATAPPRRLDDVLEERSRVKIRASESAPAERTVNEPAEPTTSVRPASRSRLQSAVDRTRQHPLEDDEPVAANTRSKPAAHPLEDDDEPPVTVRKTAAAKGNHPAVRRHPLEDSAVDEQSPQRERTATKKIIRATDAWSPPEERRGSAADPFDPIDTESIETTSVDERMMPRRQLRVANP